ncbi:flotillin family protein [Pseudochryseolinea flava]|uniref:Flotillin family protein n=1 Tax=Pseudochryseolinea flava TaxID=2059302 RepID=A0A364Y5B6_9BACT|nr:SPFH domain-containing protein [Pseudochryseolinea flava]RAW02143.1 flotillin family protein [Pseudochryseolinea flava]
MDVLGGISLLALGGIAFFIFIILIAFANFYKKIPQGKAIVRTGVGGGKVAFNKGMYVIPILHQMEIMDISVKKLQIDRLEQDGLICKDNIRADIKVAFFVRVNKNIDDVLNVAQIIGTERASDTETLRNLFEAKFSEALKTVGKKFDFIELYEARREFRTEILNIIGTDLNGYILDDCAIDFLEQTEIKFLSPQNILDSQGIKKITELTAAQNIKANLIKRDEEKTIKKQDVEAREAILELERQMAEKEEKQRREIDNVKSREQAEILKVREEERLKSESVRIKTEESLAVQEENKQRQIIIAAKNKQRTDAVETERVEKDRALEATEREKIVTLAQIEKEKTVEVERKNIQDVIRDRVRLEKGVVEEQQGVKDLEAFREVERKKTVGITAASQQAEEKLIYTVKAAEAEKKAAEEKAKQLIIDADAKKEAAVKQAEARKILAEAQAREEATKGLSEAEVMLAKAEAAERQGIVDATVIEKVADAKRKEGLNEAEVTKEKALAEAAGIQEKAEAMKKLDGVGKDHEEFKLMLAKDRDIALAQINIQTKLAEAQASIMGEALKSARIDIVGGETMFFQNIVNQISNAKGFDRLINESENATQLKTALLGDGENSGDLLSRIRDFAAKYNITSNDIKNLTISSLILKMQQQSSDADRPSLLNLANLASSLGLGNKKL